MRHNKQKIYISAAALTSTTLVRSVCTLIIGGTGMDGLTISEIIKYAVDVGMTPVLLIVFVVFFINKAKDDDEKIKNAYTDAQVQMEKNSKAIREREDMLMAESAKREEIIRSESEKRECLIRREAEKEKVY